jgi:hypothetical protein
MRHIWLKALLGTSLAVAAGVPLTALAADAGEHISAGQREMEERSYFWTGRARIISDITHKEDDVGGSGVVRAASREDARAQAQESMRQKAALWGKVLEAYVTIH